MKSEVDEDMKEVTEAVEVEGDEVEGEDNTSTKNPPDMTEDNEHSEPDWGKKVIMQMISNKKRAGLEFHPRQDR